MSNVILKCSANMIINLSLMPVIFTQNNKVYMGQHLNLKTMFAIELGSEELAEKLFSDILENLSQNWVTPCIMSSLNYQSPLPEGETHA